MTKYKQLPHVFFYVIELLTLISSPWVRMNLNKFDFIVTFELYQIESHPFRYALVNISIEYTNNISHSNPVIVDII